ncbi:M48 family metallopeptidase [Sphingomonas xanthus]|uniref:M48 family metallopeptidase n=1 Tax=Sphingomonas xanthus TaxID=2594473 RepID=A0A516IRR2_9SPHN|nr:YgjP-like metallopeptidase domain-containing protein [Sphingomonas xanthus]QDP19561.1 M48 family metallopeptidase [Sphingomonas xanthus]
MRLRLDEARGLLSLTVPRGIRRQAALDWAARQSEWVERQLERVEPAEPFAPGCSIPFSGGLLTLDWNEEGPRRAILIGERLQVGGPRTGFARRVEQYLRDEARRRLSAETQRIAETAGVSVRSVSIGDAASRWGSCSSSGAIRYNWRLVLAPPHLLRWVVAHEVAHRLHMDHGPAFHALEAQLYKGDVADARQELRRLGPRLKRVGRLL